MGRAVVDGPGGVAGGEEAVDEAGGETVAAADAVEDLQVVALDGAVEVAVVPADRAPVVVGRTVDFAQGGGGRFEVGEFFDRGGDHFFEVGDVDAGDVFINAFDFEAERGSEVFLVADHDIDVLGDLAIDLPGLGSATDGFPERGTVVEVVGDDRAVFPGGFAGFDGHFGGGFGEGREDAAGVEPAGTSRAEDVVPVDVARLHPGSGGVAAVGDALGAANAEAAFGEVESVAHGAADAVVRGPVEKGGVDAALEDEVFDETADFVVGEGRDDCRAHAEAATQPASDVVFAAAFPGLEGAGRAHAAFTGVETEHDFSEGDEVVVAVGGRSDG